MSRTVADPFADALAATGTQSTILDMLKAVMCGSTGEVVDLADPNGWQ